MKRFFVSSALFLLPLAAFAADTATIFTTVSDLISSATPVVVGLGVLFFLYGLAMYILGAADEEKKKEGRNIMIMGVIALFVMISVWGLVNLLKSTLNLDTTVPAGLKGIIPKT